MNASLGSPSRCPLVPLGFFCGRLLCQRNDSCSCCCCPANRHLSVSPRINVPSKHTPTPTSTSMPFRNQHPGYSDARSTNVFLTPDSQTLASDSRSWGERA
ncbi:hypothetical protein OH77DRAFT_483761 [Trametes cingulata]|nr:hypothetical protein OH77DRAFT_483761 [Trametes cingulata]